jgi:hypothetical protein
MTVLHAGADAVVITDDMAEGITCSNIATESGTHFYDEVGAGFTTIWTGTASRSRLAAPFVGSRVWDRVPSVRFRPLEQHPVRRDRQGRFSSG